jgi:hypothetical protein
MASPLRIFLISTVTTRRERLLLVLLAVNFCNSVLYCRHSENYLKDLLQQRELRQSKSTLGKSLTHHKSSQPF